MATDVMAAKHAEAQKRYTQRHPERARAATLRWRTGNRERHLATQRARSRRYRARDGQKSDLMNRVHHQVAVAKRSGDLVPQPCESCGSVDVVAHHDNYGKPLAVRWVCQKHHREIHS